MDTASTPHPEGTEATEHQDLAVAAAPPSPVPGEGQAAPGVAQETEAQRLDELVDEEGEESFPASDPPANY